MNPGQHAVIFLLRVYQRGLSPLLRGLFGPAGECRFTPSCSEYAREAVAVHGVLKGGALAAWRVCRCNPWGGCGEDQVPKLSPTSGMRFHHTCGAGCHSALPRGDAQSSRGLN